MTRIIAVTPAGRRGYLELLAHYVLADDSISEWHLWDNCRRASDRAYINDLARQAPKVRVVTIPAVDGTNSSVNRFYRLCNDRDVFYIKMDDDLVYLPPGFGASLLRVAEATRGQHIWWSPLVINNAICSWLVKYLSEITITAPLTAQAGCPIGWRSARFAAMLHRAFIAALDRGDIARFYVPDQPVSASRYSINCLGYFGSDVRQLREEFCPVGVDDEEWLSAVLPARLGCPGRIVGDLVVAHFGFFTQEEELLRSGILAEYYRVAGLDLAYPPVRRSTIRARTKAAVLDRWLVTGKLGTIAPAVDALEGRTGSLWPERLQPSDFGTSPATPRA